MNMKRSYRDVAPWRFTFFNAVNNSNNKKVPQKKGEKETGFARTFCFPKFVFLFSCSCFRFSIFRPPVPPSLPFLLDWFGRGLNP